MYHDALANQTVVFAYSVINNLNIRKGRIVPPISYTPDVALTAYDAAGTEIRYVQIEDQGDFEFVPQADGEVRVCLRSLNRRQKLFNFAFDVFFRDAHTQKKETNFKLNGYLNMKLDSVSTSLESV